MGRPTKNGSITAVVSYPLTQRVMSPIVRNVARVILNDEAQRQLDKLPIHLNAQVQAIIERLEQWPQVSGAKPLVGNLRGHYRIRMGDHRVQFVVAGDVVTIEKIGKRDKFYD